jgi:hypothetical protein
MSRTMATVMLLLAVSWLAGCDDSTTTAASSAAATFTFSPNPAVATPSSGLTYTIPGDSTHPDKVIEYPWKTTFTVTIEETAGVGRDISGMALKVQQASGGIIITPTGSDIEHYQYTPHASGNRLASKGKASVSFDVWYDLPNKGREALVTVSFSFTDDNKATFSESASVQVQ